MVIGSVRRAQKVRIHDVATMTDLLAARASTHPSGCSSVPTSPKRSAAATNALPPQHVEMSSVGSTALFRTLAFLAMS